MVRPVVGVEKHSADMELRVKVLGIAVNDE